MVDHQFDQLKITMMSTLISRNVDQSLLKALILALKHQMVKFVLCQLNFTHLKFYLLLLRLMSIWFYMFCTNRKVHGEVSGNHPGQ